jgi:hypothetical protein
MKQTTVEWLEQQIELIPFNSPEAFDFYEECMVLVNQAKELEKQQIVKAVFDSMGTNLDPNIGRAEQYYNETYKNTKE